MRHTHINLAENAHPIAPKKRSTWVTRLILYPLIFVGMFCLVFTVSALMSGNSIMESFKKISDFNTFSFSSDDSLGGKTRINFLLTGQGGLGHEGPFLTDTMIFASIDQTVNTVGMMSIPRDLAIPDERYGWLKVNHLNSMGETSDDKNGAEYAAEKVGEVLHQPIDYYVRIDFQGFTQLIDTLGGLEITVDNAFIDTEYPTYNYGYKTIAFEAGTQKMDGETALDYARSRHGNNGEASDFARSKRQQKVIVALKDKVASFSTLFSFRKISALYETFHDNVSTNVSIKDAVTLIKIAKRLSTDSIHTVVLSDAPDGVLYASFINESYVLLPKDKTYTELVMIAEHVWQRDYAYERPTPPNIEIQNGTPIEGLAYRTSLRVKPEGFEVVKIGNADEKTYTETVVYDFSSGKNAPALDKLKKLFPAAKIINAFNSSAGAVDFLIILGEDSDVTGSSS